MKSEGLVDYEIECGPRKVTRAGGSAAVYLGKEFEPLIGRRVILVIKVLRREIKRIKER